jgi:lipopolysaccharide assembly outer membrane protein LptD (OstA)
MVNNIKKIFFSFLILFFKERVLFAKKTKVTISADQLTGGKDENNINYKFLSGNVCIVYENFNLYSDYATYLDDSKDCIAYGNVKIIDHKNNIFTAEKIHYKDKNKIAEAFGEVEIKSDENKIVINTENASYDTRKQLVYFKNKSKIKQDENIITANKGYFDNKNKIAYIYEDVLFENKDYEILSQDATYELEKKNLILKKKIIVINKDGNNSLISRNGGVYNTDSQIGNFFDNEFQSDKFQIKCEKIEINKKKKVHSISGNIEIYEKQADIYLFSDYGTYDKEREFIELFGKNIFIKKLDGDDLYVSSDRIFAKKNEDDSNFNIHASGNLKIYKSDIQACANEFVYNEKDEIIEIIGSPIFWNHKNQITSEKAILHLKEKKLEKIEMFPKGFFVFKDEIGNFNQICGDKILINFKKNNVSTIQIMENVQVIYFVINKNDIKGINILQSGEIFIDLESQNIKKIEFPLRSKGIFYPKHLAKDLNLFLKNFQWREEERPTFEQVYKSKINSNNVQISV